MCGRRKLRKEPKESILGGGVSLAAALECVPETLKGKGSQVGTEDKAISLWVDSSPSLSPGGSDDRESTCNVEDRGAIPRLGRYTGEGNGNPYQYSCLENAMDRGTWWGTIHGGHKESERLSDLQ